jgi:hypothetical protein
MKQKNLRQRDLVPMTGSRGRVSEVLARKRALTATDDPPARGRSRPRRGRADSRDATTTAASTCGQGAALHEEEVRLTRRCDEQPATEATT